MRSRRGAAAARIRAIADGPLLVEEYVPGVEVAVEGLLRDGVLHVLAVFDKPDPLVGPVLRGDDLRHAVAARRVRARLASSDVTARACAALGLVEGPMHAEVRVDGDRVSVIEVAARSIGGLCARTLRFGGGHRARGAGAPPRARHAARRARPRSRARRA